MDWENSFAVSRPLLHHFIAHPVSFLVLSLERQVAALLIPLQLI